MKGTYTLVGFNSANESFKGTAGHGGGDVAPGLGSDLGLIGWGTSGKS